MDLKKDARMLPERPGIYIMKDEYGNIIYVGKAKNLKNRVSQYFQSSSRHAPKIVRMIENIRTFDYIPCDTELEALLLECRLIKDLKPMYNSQMKNDLGYVYIRIALEEKFPFFEIIEENEEGGTCFGPYSSAKSVERALKALQDNFKLRYCKSLETRKSGCLRQQIGLCTAPCIGGINSEEYMELVKSAVCFLEGRNLGLLVRLEENMRNAAEALDFGKAAKYRDDLKSLRRLIGRQRAVSFNQGSRSITAIEKLDADYAKFFILQGSHIIYKTKLNLSGSDAGMAGKLIAGMIMEHLKDKKKEAFRVDKKEIDQAHIVYSYLKNKKGCGCISIPKSWLKQNNIDKLERGAEKLIAKVHLT